jgi:hypothetical protein
MNNNAPSAIVLRGVRAICYYTKFDSNEQSGLLKDRRDSGSMPFRSDQPEFDRASHDMGASLSA